MDLTDRVVLITGAGAGIGKATAECCADHGATVVVTDVDAESARAVAEGIDAESARLDVRDPERFEAVIEETVSAFGRIDGLVNNAGIGQPPNPVEDVEDETRDAVLAVNLYGTWNGTRAVVPRMKEQGSGAIVNVSSLAGQIGLANFSAYSLTKGAVLNFTRAVATELGPHGVRANAVCPGFVETALSRDYFDASGDPDRARKRMEASYPLKRLGEPEEVADPIVFLLSERASYVTGHGFTIDGGYSAG